MTHESLKSSSALEVHIRFEVSRLSARHLARAYEQIVPIVCRTIRDINPKAQLHSPPIQPETGGLSR